MNSYFFLIVAGVTLLKSAHSFSFADRKTSGPSNSLTDNYVLPRGVFLSNSRSNKMHKRGKATGTGGFLEIAEAPPKLIEARQHGKTVLECSASGNPPPEITWYKDGEPLMSQTRSLNKISSRYGVSQQAMSETKSRVNLDCVSEQDAGLYECVAHSSKMKTSVETQINVASFKGNGCVPRHLVKMETKTPTIYQWMDTYMQKIGSDARLVCRADGIHVIVWVGPEGEPIDVDTKKYTTLPSGDLVIHDLDFTDMGIFKCHATNEFGDDVAETFVYPHAA